MSSNLKIKTTFAFSFSSDSVFPLISLKDLLFIYSVKEKKFFTPKSLELNM
jgi:hypothetical protein